MITSIDFARHNSRVYTRLIRTRHVITYRQALALTLGAKQRQRAPVIWATTTRGE